MRRDATRKARVMAMLLAVAIVLCLLPTVAGAIESRNQLLNSNSNVQSVETKDRFLNLLLLGVDYGTRGYWGSGIKRDFDDCHTDSVMVVSLNLDQQKVDLVSIPRDTFTYVPNVRGVYKLNGAINCSDTIDEGIQRVCDAVSWLLGGIPIHRYFLVDMNSAILLGDTIGGIDFDLDMSYRGRDGKNYRKGFQHLDGQGIMDYLRARKNASVNGNDIGRTERNRKMVSAILAKLRNNPLLIPKVLMLASSGDHHVYTSITMEDVWQLLKLAATMENQKVGSHVLVGRYMNALKWRFAFMDQDHRVEVLRQVYGIEAQPIPYVNMRYAKWLGNVGFTYARYLFVADELLHHAKSATITDSDQLELLSDFELTFADTVIAFEQAAESTKSKDTEVLKKKARQLTTLGDKLKKTLQLTELPSWRGTEYWYRDPVLYQYPKIRWQ